MSELVGTPAQIAEALETSEDSVLYLKQHCGLPHVYINRQQWRVPWVALTDWLTTEAARNALHNLEAAS
jgi:hypothetical protein